MYGHIPRVAPVAQDEQKTRLTTPSGFLQGERVTPHEAAPLVKKWIDCPVRELSSTRINGRTALRRSYVGPGTGKRNTPRDSEYHKMGYCTHGSNRARCAVNNGSRYVYTIPVDVHVCNAPTGIFEGNIRSIIFLASGPRTITTTKQIAGRQGQACNQYCH
jgi:hypothetical protein